MKSKESKKNIVVHTVIAENEETVYQISGTDLEVIKEIKDWAENTPEDYIMLPRQWKVYCMGTVGMLEKKTGKMKSKEFMIIIEEM